ncbi:MAG: 4-hydroxythreonine-4-phosphate dehydrogenase PdxA [Chloroflexi bacterium]|nr:4-hydroxythreonine-4-phosphate dehydrogenase PdxA [Chloroflexota bacterium]
MTTDQRPLVGVTIGDPAGVGPEIVLRALEDAALYEVARPVVLGASSALRRAAGVVGSRARLHTVERPADGLFQRGTIDLVDLDRPELSELAWGRVQEEAGRAAFEFIRCAIDLALVGELDALATAPINKEALQAGGVPFIDHTSMLKELTNSPDVLTMFVARRLVIFFMARHMSMRRACDEVTAQNVASTLCKAHAAMASFGTPRARFGVAALNPHAGENGLFGDEEITQIRPGVERARAEGVDAYGPIPADAVFHQCLQGRYDAVLSLHHDQGHIAAKTYDFERTISITSGLPFVRASVDHGTAFDIAGQGIASAVGMSESIRLAAEYAGRLAEHGAASA